MQRWSSLMVQLNVNGKIRQVDVAPDTPLLWVLRDTLGLTGTKYGCGQALCGACTVHVDGAPLRSCVTPVSAVAGRKITTIEVADQSRIGKAVQEAWQKLDVVQCGYCQSGQIMTAVALLSQNRKPTDADIDTALSGNLCRCATYVRIRAAIHLAAKSLA
jgi:isoquinoline 1-oxidoreductase subunit alpha